MDMKDDIAEDVRYVEDLFLPLVKFMVKKLIESIPLKSVTDMQKYEVRIYGYLYMYLKGLPAARQKIVIEQALGALDFALMIGLY